MSQIAGTSKSARLSFEEFKQGVLDDYRMAVASREASLIGRREVLTGKAKFVSGTVEQGAKGGPRYSMVFEAEEPQNQVVDWYDNVFRMYKWGSIQKSTSSVSATHKEGHFASISTDDKVNAGANNPKIHSSFTVHYQMAVR